jgi:hypothetical protein
MNFNLAGFGFSGKLTAASPKMRDNPNPAMAHYGLQMR